MKDVIDELQAVTRTVGSGSLPAGDAHVVTLERTYPADIDEVWSAITTKERIARWFLPVSGDLRPGGTYQLEGNAGGEIRVCEPPRRLQVTWICGPPPGPEDSSIVDVRLEPTGGGTRLVLEHTSVFPDEMWERYGPGSIGVGWDLTVLGLVLHLQDEGWSVAPELESSPEIRAYMTASSAAWGDALAATGADGATVARNVAETTAFYAPPAD